MKPTTENSEHCCAFMCGVEDRAGRSPIPRAHTDYLRGVEDSLKRLFLPSHFLPEP